MSTKTGFWIGTYTRPGKHAQNIQGQGIIRGYIDDATGALEMHTASKLTPDPSYLSIKGDLLYAVSEKMGEPGELHAYRILNGSQLEFINATSTGGINACYLAPHGNGIMVANYFSSELAFLVPDSWDWKLMLSKSYSGKGPNALRQEQPHVHHCAYLAASGHVAVCDLGSDRVWLHRADESNFHPAVDSWLALPPGTGPRHLLARGNNLYILGELSGRLHHFYWQDGTWVEISRSESVCENPSCAAIHCHPNASMLYISERAQSHLYGFILHPVSGAPLFSQVIPTLAVTPRDFGFTPNGKWLLILGQDSSTISVHEVDAATGLVSASTPKNYACGTPVCIVFD